MSCKYIYKGHTFDSEYKLDDFLIEKAKYESVLGDIVFDLSSGEVEAIAKLKHADDDFKSRYKDSVSEDDTLATRADKPKDYAGVTHFLSRLKTKDGKYLFPDVVRDEYFSRRLELWKMGNFDNEDELEIIKNKFPSFDPAGTHTDAEYEEYRKQIEKVWDKKAVIGTSVHNLMKKYFDHVHSKSPDGKVVDMSSFVLKGDKNISDDLAKIIKLGCDKLYNWITINFPNSIVITENGFTCDTLAFEDLPRKITGKCDLIIVDLDGNSHIIDYKTSSLTDMKSDDIKCLTYSYLLATYQRALLLNGILSYGNKYVFPIRIFDFKLDESDKAKFNIEFKLDLFNPILDTAEEHILELIDLFLAKPPEIKISGSDVVSNVAKDMKKCFSDYTPPVRASDEENKAFMKDLAEKIKANPSLKDDLGVYHYVDEYGHNFEDKDLVNLVKRVLAKKNGMIAKQDSYYDSLLKDIRTAIEEKSVSSLETTDADVRYKKTGHNSDYIKHALAKYADGNWEVYEDEGDILRHYGIIMLRSKPISGLTPQIDIIRVGTNILERNYRSYKSVDKAFKNRKYLTGCLIDDRIEESDSNSLMEEATYGNVMLMETMMVLNNLSGFGDYKIGDVSVMNYGLKASMKMSNQALQYCFNRFHELGAIEKSKIGSEIKFIDPIELILNELRMICEYQENGEFVNRWGDSVAEDSNIYHITSETDIDVKIQKLLDLLLILEKKRDLRSDFMDPLKLTIDLLAKPHVKLWADIHMAIALLRNVNFKLLVKDNDFMVKKEMKLNSFLEDLHLGSVFGNMGMLGSNTLNQLGNWFRVATLNLREKTIVKDKEVSKRVKELRDAVGSPLWNEASMYKDMTYINSDGDFMFKNPNSMPLEVLRKFLKSMIRDINRYRFGDSKTEELLDAMERNNDVQYYRVPIFKGGFESTLTLDSLLNLGIEGLKENNPMIWWDKFKTSMRGDNVEAEDSNNSNIELFMLLNQLKSSEDPELRKLIIEKIGLKHLERNLGYLWMKCMYVSEYVKLVNEIMPMVKAACMHVAMSGSWLNTKFEGDIKYALKYITHAIHNKRIDLSHEGKSFGDSSVGRKITRLKSMASGALLAFSPIQLIYQPLSNFISIVREAFKHANFSGENTSPYSFSNLWFGFKTAWGDLFSGSNSVVSLLNLTYGMNNTDSNTFIEENTSYRSFFMNGLHTAYAFSSRPDYYARMGLLIANMKNDGCYEAHSINKDGVLVYDIKKDNRFKAFINGDTRNPKYEELKSLFYAMANLFIAENALNPDGTKYKLDMKHPNLPKAYTVKQAEDVKNLCDKLYGFYDHDRKSLMHASWIGGLLFQFKGYITGRIHNYTRHGSVGLEGKFELFKNDKGELMYYQVDSSGKPLFHDKITTNPTGFPVTRWNGLWEEGILITLGGFFNTLAFKGGFNAAIDKYFRNPDPAIRRAYAANMRLLIYDILCLLIFGCVVVPHLTNWHEDNIKENKGNKDWLTGLKLSGEGILVHSIHSAFGDFNVFDSLISPMFSLEPYAFKFTQKRVGDLYSLMMGDKNAVDTLVDMFGTTKALKPFFDSIKSDDYRKKSEGGYYETARAKLRREIRERGERTAWDSFKLFLHL